MSPEGKSALQAQLRALASGDRGAAQPAFNALWPILHAFCGRVLGASEADDAAQRALVRLFEQVSDVETWADPVAWALEIASWECRTELKRRARAKTNVERISLEALIDEPPPADAQLAAVQEQQQLSNALTSLSTTDRETLQALLGDDNRAHAQSTAMRKRKQRALERLKSVWRTLYGHH